MKLTLSQIEIETAIKDYLNSNGYYTFKKDLNWVVEWDQQYDNNPTNIEVSVQL